jgi:16S rRNA U516 pseudouridylate synthase RsuA-like enzyme
MSPNKVVDFLSNLNNTASRRHHNTIVTNSAVTIKRNVVFNLRNVANNKKETIQLHQEIVIRQYFDKNETLILRAVELCQLCRRVKSLLN